MSSNSESGIIRTVLGDIRPADTGHIQCHEHIYLRKGPSCAVSPALLMDDPARSRQELEQYRDAGGYGMVDAQPGGCGRDAAMLARLSRESGVAIVAVTGFHKRCFWEPDSGLDLPDQDALTARFTGEIEQGMLSPDGSRTDWRAGVIKTALEADGPDQADYRRLFSAAAAAARATGAPVMVHTEPNTDVLRLAEWFGNAGISPHRLIFCHLDRTCSDPAVHRTLLQMGCWSCCDSIHRLKYLSDAQELSLLRRLRDWGCLPRMLASLDTTNQRLRAYQGEIGLDYILTQYLPQLQSAGFTDAELRQLCIENPRRALTMGQTEKG